MGKLNVEQASDQTSISHFSHPHPLKLSNLPPHQPFSFCSACKLETSSSVYSCTICSFLLHPKCSQLPQQIRHPFDQNHALFLHPKPVYPEGLFNCDACGNHGDGFSYHCGACGIDLHSTCASLPMLFTHECHQHQLSLTFSAPYPGNSFSCDVCKRVGSKTWLYRCNMCEFDVHLTCVSTITPSNSIHQQITARAIPPPSDPINPPYPRGYGAPMPPRNQFVATPYPVPTAQNQFAATPYPAAMPPVNCMPYNNPNLAAYNIPARPANNGLMDQLMVGAVNGVASGAAQSATQALIQGFMGGGGSGGGGGGGDVSHVDVMGGGGGMMGGGSYYDGGYGAMDGGDGSYYVP
ncbi:hypothetical protein Pfo_005608 [Paulownia fortunei]|nr:hypothetical protein Pfo_005608 [Paulownia fortunei]